MSAQRSTHKEARYIAARLQGRTREDAARIAGLPLWIRSRDVPGAEAAIAEASELLARQALEAGLGRDGTP